MFRPVHFEIHATHIETVRAFYESVFGWQFQQWGDIPYWVVTTGQGDPAGDQPEGSPGVNGGMLQRRGDPPGAEQPVNAFVMTVEVPDCDLYLQRALAAGGSIALPASDMPGVGRLAYIKDPDGNILGMLQAEPPTT